MNEIKLGSRVHWTQTGTRGRTMTLRRKEGVVTGVSADYAMVKSSKTTYLVRLSDLALAGQPGELDQVVRTVREDATGSPEGPRTWAED